MPFVLGPAGQNDVVQAAGQTIPLSSGNYTALFLIGTAVQGGKTGTFTMHYTDGSTSVVTQEFSDWANDSSNPGESVVRTMSYRNYSQNNGLQTLTMYAYGYSLPITPGKTLQSVTLPANADINILSMDLVGPQSQVSLSSQFNQVGLTCRRPYEPGESRWRGLQLFHQCPRRIRRCLGRHDIQPGIGRPE